MTAKGKDKDLQRLCTLRSKIVEKLGDENAKLYFGHMRAWFSFRLSRQDFDFASRKLFDTTTEEKLRPPPPQTPTPHQRSSHLTDQSDSVSTSSSVQPSPSGHAPDGHGPCSKPVSAKVDTAAAVATAAATTAPPDAKRRRKELMLERIRRNVLSRLGQGRGNDGDVLPYIDRPPKPTSNVHYMTREANLISQDELLPDSAMLNGRVMLIAWDHGLHGSRHNSAHLLLEALQCYLKDVIEEAVRDRSGFRLREGSFRWGSTPPPDPYLRSRAALHSTFELTVGDEFRIRDRPEPDLSTMVDSADYRPTQPLTIFHLYSALKKHRQKLGKSWTVYRGSLERISGQLFHPSPDDDELDVT